MFIRYFEFIDDLFNRLEALSIDPITCVVFKKGSSSFFLLNVYVYEIIFLICINVMAGYISFFKKYYHIFTDKKRLDLPFSKKTKYFFLKGLFLFFSKKKVLIRLKNVFKKKVNLESYFDFFIFFCKKYIYTINHKRIAMNYFFFSLWTAMSGTLLATIIRLELAYPGSHFFKGDSIKYLQVITAHGLIMVFFVVVPIIFGFLANFFIPYHIGSKDVAFPRLNSLGF